MDRNGPERSNEKAEKGSFLPHALGRISAGILRGFGFGGKDTEQRTEHVQRRGGVSRRSFLRFALAAGAGAALGYGLKTNADSQGIDYREAFGAEAFPLPTDPELVEAEQELFDTLLEQARTFRDELGVDYPAPDNYVKVVEDAVTAGRKTPRFVELTSGWAEKNASHKEIVAATTKRIKDIEVTSDFIGFIPEMGHDALMFLVRMTPLSIFTFDSLIFTNLKDPGLRGQYDIVHKKIRMHGLPGMSDNRVMPDDFNQTLYHEAGHGDEFYQQGRKPFITRDRFHQFLERDMRTRQRAVNDFLELSPEDLESNPIKIGNRLSDAHEAPEDAEKAMRGLALELGITNVDASFELIAQKLLELHINSLHDTSEYGEAVRDRREIRKYASLVMGIIWHDMVNPPGENTESYGDTYSPALQSFLATIDGARMSRYLIAGGWDIVSDNEFRDRYNAAFREFAYRIPLEKRKERHVAAGLTPVQTFGSEEISVYQSSGSFSDQLTIYLSDDSDKYDLDGMFISFDGIKADAQIKSVEISHQEYDLRRTPANPITLIVTLSDDTKTSVLVYDNSLGSHTRSFAIDSDIVGEVRHISSFQPLGYGMLPEECSFELVTDDLTGMKLLRYAASNQQAALPVGHYPVPDGRSVSVNKDDYQILNFFGGTMLASREGLLVDDSSNAMQRWLDENDFDVVGYLDQYGIELEDKEAFDEFLSGTQNDMVDPRLSLRYVKTGDNTVRPELIAVSQFASFKLRKKAA
jgi:hypothetical protein